MYEIHLASNVKIYQVTKRQTIKNDRFNLECIIKLFSFFNRVLIFYRSAECTNVENIKYHANINADVKCTKCRKIKESRNSITNRKKI